MASGVYVDCVLRPAAEQDAAVFAELADASAAGALPDVIRERVPARLAIARQGCLGA